MSTHTQFFLGISEIALGNFLLVCDEEGIFTANHAHTEDDGASWKLQRKIASRIFTGNRFRNYMQGVFLNHGKTVLKVIDGHAKSGGKFDIVSV